MQEILLPTKVDMGKYKRATTKHKIGDSKKSYILNLNVFRNSSSFHIKAADVKFRDKIQKHFCLSKVNTLVIVYVLYVKGNRKKDLNNVISIVDKFFADLLVENNIIPDDNYEYYKGTVSLYGGKCEGDDYVHAYILDTTKDNVPEIVANLIKETICKKQK